MNILMYSQRLLADTLPSHGPLDHHITLEGDVKLGYSPLYKCHKKNKKS